ncbi:RING finger protein nhl-1 [Armadillidium vulgare]|nr:RING finger protein nhl-1 [Armadillidium vulgare]
MEEVTTCNICTSEFNNFEKIPKILPCGHTFCFPCIEKIIDENPSCPKCRAEINVSLDSLPTNQSILRSTDIYKSVKSSEKRISTSVNVLKRKCLGRLDSLNFKKTKVTSSIEVLEECLKKIQELPDPETEAQNIDMKKAEEILKGVNKDFKKTDDDDSPFSRNLKNKISLHLAAFESSRKYLLEIYRKVVKEEDIFSAHQIGNDLRFGKISVQDNKLLFHSLTLCEVPEDSQLILFNDLKDCVDEKNFFCFMEFSFLKNKTSQMLFFRMYDKYESLIFIKLCTGECGPSYMNDFRLQKGKLEENFHTIFSLQFETQNMKNLVSYAYGEEKTPVQVDCDPKETYIMLNKRGRFDVGRSLFSCQYTVYTLGKVGTVDISNNVIGMYLNANPSDKLLSSGILFTI